MRAITVPACVPSLCLRPVCFTRRYYAGQAAPEIKPNVSVAPRLYGCYLSELARAWPRAAIFFRTMFKSTDKGFALGSSHEYGSLNRAMRDTCRALDLSALLHYSDATGECTHGHPNGTGSCSRESRWTVDGLHPPRWIMRQYGNMALHSFAELVRSAPVSAAGRR